MLAIPNKQAHLKAARGGKKNSWLHLNVGGKAEGCADPQAAVTPRAFANFLKPASRRQNPGPAPEILLEYVPPKDEYAQKYTRPTPTGLQLLLESVLLWASFSRLLLKCRLF